MIHVFYRNRNTIGQFMVALMFLGTFGFLFTYDGFVSKSAATSCCGGGEAVVTSFTADSSGDFGGDVPMDVEVTDGRYGGKDNIPFSSDNNGDSDCACISGGCGECGSSKCSSSSNPSCETRCEGPGGGNICGPDNYGCCQDQDDEYCPNDDDADTECCQYGDC